MKAYTVGSKKSSEDIPSLAHEWGIKGRPIIVYGFKDLPLHSTDYAKRILAQPDKIARFKALKDAQKSFRQIVENFAKENPGKITVDKDDLWISQALQVHAEPDIAKKLSEVPGIGEVYESQKSPPRTTPKQLHRSPSGP